jgi:septum site-determining protein MinC
VATVLAPEHPIDAWIEQLDALISRSQTFFLGRPVVLDLHATPLGRADVMPLMEALQKRGIRVIAVEGAGALADTMNLPHPLFGGRSTEDVALPDGSAAAAAKPAEAAPPQTSLLVESPVRSGQSVIFNEGDVTVVGSVASGAEIIAGGSIHVYGALRGRAIAGVSGQSGARIYCRKLEAELLAIDGLYKTAEEIDPGLWGRPAQARLEGDAMLISLIE